MTAQRSQASGQMRGHRPRLQRKVGSELLCCAKAVNVPLFYWTQSPSEEYRFAHVLE
jgi:hypothetical protein